MDHVTDGPSVTSPSGTVTQQVSAHFKLVAYRRISSSSQLDGYGLDVQEKDIRAWAKRNGHRVVHWCDDVVSGTSDALDRDGLVCAFETVQGGEVDGLVVPRLDRLARSLTVQEATLALFWKAGARVFTVDGGEVLQDDPDDPMRTAMRQVMGTFAQLERAMLRKRMEAGRRYKHERGGYAGFGSPRFGVRSTDKVLVPDPVEQACLTRMRELHTAGRSLREIAATLTDEGHAPKRGGCWHPMTVARALR